MVPPTLTGAWPSRSPGGGGGGGGGGPWPSVRADEYHGILTGRLLQLHRAVPERVGLGDEGLPGTNVAFQVGLHAQQEILVGERVAIVGLAQQRSIRRRDS